MAAQKFEVQTANLNVVQDLGPRGHKTAGLRKQHIIKKLQIAQILSLF